MTISRFNIAPGSVNRRKVLLWLVVGGGLSALFAVLARYMMRRRRLDLAKLLEPEDSINLKLQQRPNTTDVFDVAIVGAGPAGSAAAWFLAKRHPSLRVLLIDKQQFPRDKVCGDLISAEARKYLRDMGVLDALKSQKAFVEKERFISAGGSVVERTITALARKPIIVKRQQLDQALLAAALAVGVTVFQGYDCTRARFSPAEKGFTLACEVAAPQDPSRSEAEEESSASSSQNNQATVKVEFKTKFLICADGASSSLARQLRMAKDDPSGAAARTYLSIHDTKIDNGILHQRKLVPGHVKVTKTADGDLNYNTFIIPGGKTKPRELTHVHNLCAEDYTVKQVVGGNVAGQTFEAQIRCVPLTKPFRDMCLVIGEAAGLVNPTTGYGIQYAFESADLASKVAAMALANNKTDENYLALYSRLLRAKIVNSIENSASLNRMQQNWPAIFEASVRLANKRGESMREEFWQVLSGSRSWSSVFVHNPAVLFALLLEIVRGK